MSDICIPIDPATGQPLPGYTLPVKLTRAHMQNEVGPNTYQTTVSLEDGLVFYCDLPNDAQYAVYREAEKEHYRKLSAWGQAANQAPAVVEGQSQEDAVAARDAAMEGMASEISTSAVATAEILFIPLVKGWGELLVKSDDEKRGFILPDKTAVVMAIIAKARLGVDTSNFLVR